MRIKISTARRKSRGHELSLRTRRIRGSNATAFGQVIGAPVVVYEMRQLQRARIDRAVRIDKPSVNVGINFKVNPLVVGQRCRKKTPT